MLLTGILSNALSQYTGLIYPSAFVLFFVGAGIAILYADRDLIRNGFVISLLCGFLVVNLVGVNLLPLAHLHKYSNSPDQDWSQYEIRLVDESGKELRLDSRAMTPIDDRSDRLAKQMTHEYSENEQLETGELILKESTAYRETLSSDSLSTNAISFPPPSVNYRWSKSQLAQYGEFSRVRVYRINRTYESNSHTLIGKDTTRLLEVAPENNRVNQSMGA